MRLFFGLVCILFLVESCSVTGSIKKYDDKKVDKSYSTTEAELYDKIILKDADTEKGLFTVYKVGDKYFFEVADSLLTGKSSW